MHTLVIANPAAGGGRVRRRWPELKSQIEAALGPTPVQWTTERGSATALTRSALQNGVDRIVAVGGDGTLNEVVNGFFDAGDAIRPDAVLAPLPCGTGSDFCRTLGVSTDALAALDRSPVRRVDLGRARFTDPHGALVSRWFVNVASFGLGGSVVRTVDRMPAKAVLGGFLGYLGAILFGLATFGTPRVRLRVDDAPWASLAVRDVSIANGQFFGGGLRIAPAARLDDGCLDVVAVGDVPIRTLVRRAARFYHGTHLDLDGVRATHGRRIDAEPEGDGAVPLQLDGEAVGRLPATFTVVPRALRVQG